MTNVQVSTARRFATAAFAGVVALSLMLPAQLAFADYSVDGSEYYSATADKDGTGSGGGTWSYEADGYEMTLVDYVGGAIQAYDQDLNIQLEGDNTVTGVVFAEGNLTITGDDTVYGLDKPSLTIKDDGNGNGSISSGADLAIEDANIYFDSEEGVIWAFNNLTIENSATWRGDANAELNIWAWSYGDTAKANNMTLKGSEINATNVYAGGKLTIDNTNLTVVPDKWEQELIDAGTFGDVPWVVYAVQAVKGIELIGEDNGEVIEYTNAETGQTWYYLYTGDDNKVELKASETPAYWGPQGMPQTGDALPFVGFGIAAAFAGIIVAFSLRRTAVSGKHVK